MSWTKRVKHPSEVLKKGDLVHARITHIDADNQRVSLSIKEFLPNEWENFVAEPQGRRRDRRRGGQRDRLRSVHRRLRRPRGLAHVSEIEVGGRLEDHYKVGDFVRARILRIEEEEKKVGLSLRGVTQPTDEEKAEMEAAAASRAAAQVAEAAAAEENSSEG
jgi:small subunit ribosomal protein S1